MTDLSDTEIAELERLYTRGVLKTMQSTGNVLRALSELRRRREEQTGMPGAIAPKDGSDVQVFIPGGYARAYWDAELKTFVLSRPLHIESVRDPKYFRLLPPAPSEKREDIGE